MPSPWPFPACRFCSASGTSPFPRHTGSAPVSGHSDDCPSHAAQILPLVRKFFSMAPVEPGILRRSGEAGGFACAGKATEGQQRPRKRMDGLASAQVGCLPSVKDGPLTSLPVLKGRRYGPLLFVMQLPDRISRIAKGVFFFSHRRSSFPEPHAWRGISLVQKKGKLPVVHLTACAFSKSAIRQSARRCWPRPCEFDLRNTTT